eukprot:gene15179-biopygen15250
MSAIFKAIDSASLTSSRLTKFLSSPSRRLNDDRILACRPMSVASTISTMVSFKSRFCSSSKQDKMSKHSSFISSNMHDTWTFSSTDLSLNRTDKYVCALTWKLLLIPGWL